MLEGSCRKFYSFSSLHYYSSSSLYWSDPSSKDIIRFSRICAPASISPMLRETTTSRYNRCKLPLYISLPGPDFAAEHNIIAIFLYVSLCIIFMSYLPNSIFKFKLPILQMTRLDNLDSFFFLREITIQCTKLKLSSIIVCQPVSILRIQDSPINDYYEQPKSVRYSG